MTKKVRSVVVADARGQPIPKFGEAPLSVLLSGDHQIHDEPLGQQNEMLASISSSAEDVGDNLNRLPKSQAELLDILTKRE